MRVERAIERGGAEWRAWTGWDDGFWHGFVERGRFWTGFATIRVVVTGTGFCERIILSAARIGEGAIGYSNHTAVSDREKSGIASAEAGPAVCGGVCRAYTGV